jgi:hypothetical protein
VARKSAKKRTQSLGRAHIPEDVKLDKATRKFLATTEALREEIVPDSAEDRAFLSYLRALVSYETAWAFWMSLGDKPKDMDRFREVSREVEIRQAAMFRAFDGWQATAKRTFHVDVEDVRQVVYDALMANTEAMPDNYQELDPRTRAAEYRRVADDLISLMQGDRVQVTEQDMDAPYCESCQTVLGMVEFDGS